jgi:hypothetical protein
MSLLIKYKKSWNLKYIEYDEKELERKLSETSIDTIQLIVEHYPNIDPNIISCSGDLVLGNYLTNFIIELLLDQSKIVTKCLRLSSFWTLDELKDLRMQEYEVILLDNLEFSLFNNTQKEILLQFIDYLQSNAKLIILNVPDTKEWSSAPKTLLNIVTKYAVNMEFRDAE